MLHHSGIQSSQHSLRTLRNIDIKILHSSCGISIRIKGRSPQNTHEQSNTRNIKTQSQRQNNISDNNLPQKKGVF